MSHNTTARSLMTIGEFSRRSRLSLKALRLYDELGLLRPASVDESSGYRYYGDDQIEPARLIGLLRQLEMQLERIARVLELPADDRTAEVRRFWAETEVSVALKRRLVAYLERYLEGRGDTMYDVKTRQVPEQQVLTITRNVKQPELRDFLMEASSAIAASFDGTSIGHAPFGFVVYHGVVSHDSDGPVEVCLPFEGAIEAPAGMQVRTEPAHAEAYTTITLAQCEYPRILEAYDAVQAFLEKRGIEQAGPPREVYFVAGETARPEDPFCDIAWPMAQAARPLVSTRPG